MSLSGMFNIGHDVAGFSGPTPQPELLVRFAQGGALHPRFVMNSWKADGTVTTPWLHAEALPAIHLRYRLMPYLYSLYRRAADRGEPILRPTFFDFLLVPAGAMLPLTADARDYARLHAEPSRCVRIFPGRESGQSSFALYEDDGLSLRHREGDFAELNFRLDWDRDAVRLRLARRGGYALPYDTVTVALPAAERRRLVLESASGAPQLVAGNWQLHSLHA